MAHFTLAWPMISRVEMGLGPTGAYFLPAVRVLFDPTQ